MLALVKDNANHCLIDLKATFVDFFATEDYFTTGLATLEIPIWKV